jgi:type IV pilus assembly protein PilC
MNFKTISLWKKKEKVAVAPVIAVSNGSFDPYAPIVEKKKGKVVLFLRFTMKEQAYFAKRLAFLIGAGVSMLESLHLLRDQSKSAGKKYIYSEIIADVTNGLYLSTSLKKFERFFGNFAINIIKIGESGGVLIQNLNYLADELQKKEELRKKVVGALIYPIFITVATLLLCGGLTVFIFPKVMPIFQSLSVDLPLSTRVLLWISNFLGQYGFYVIVGVILLVVLLRIMIAFLPTFRFLMHQLTLKLPIFGKLIMYYNMANFTRTLALLLKSGTNIVEAVTITGETMGNEVYQRECKAIAEVVLRGDRISKYLIKRQHIFPDFTAHLVAVGETTGSLPDTLMYLSNMYDAEVSDMTKNLSNSIEPILMVFMGTLVGLIAVSVITPIYEVTQHLKP